MMPFLREIEGWEFPKVSNLPDCREWVVFLHEMGLLCIGNRCKTRDGQIVIAGCDA